MAVTQNRPATIQVVVVDHSAGEFGILGTLSYPDNFSVQFATSGGDALRLANRLRVDLWLICTQLPDFSGFDIVEMLQPLPLGTAVFLIGTEYRSADELRALQLGVTKYLVKPLSTAWWLDIRQRPPAKDVAIRTPLVRASPDRVPEAKP